MEKILKENMENIRKQCSPAELQKINEIDRNMEYEMMISDESSKKLEKLTLTETEDKAFENYLIDKLKNSTETEYEKSIGMNFLKSRKKSNFNIKIKMGSPNTCKITYLGEMTPDILFLTNLLEEIYNHISEINSQTTLIRLLRSEGFSPSVQL